MTLRLVMTGAHESSPLGRLCPARHQVGHQRQLLLLGPGKCTEVGSYSLWIIHSRRKHGAQLDRRGLRRILLRRVREALRQRGNRLHQRCRRGLGLLGAASAQPLHAEVALAVRVELKLLQARQRLLCDATHRFRHFINWRIRGGAMRTAPTAPPPAPRTLTVMSSSPC